MALVVVTDTAPSSDGKTSSKGVSNMDSKHSITMYPLSRESIEANEERHVCRSVLAMVALVALFWGLFAIIIPAVANAEAKPQSTETAERITFIEEGDTYKRHLKVTYIEVVGPLHHSQVGSYRNLYVEFNNGGAAYVTPCKAEGDDECYWLGQLMGNQIGGSVLSLFNGKTIPIREHLLYEAHLLVPAHDWTRQ